MFSQKGWEIIILYLIRHIYLIHLFATQLEEGKCFFAHKYPEMKYLAYFQAYTNTYAAHPFVPSRLGQVKPAFNDIFCTL